VTDETPPLEVSFEVPLLAARARALHAEAGRRIVLGITGPPGAGKSTIAAELLAELGEAAVIVPMDGFHFSNAVLRTLGRESRKGAPDTFDVGGYVALLDRIRVSAAEVIYGPSFDREIDEPIANDVMVAPTVQVVITEGNYLLTPGHGWGRVRPLLDQVWYVDVDPGLRRSRLTARHSAFGKDPRSAEEWANGPDEANAQIVTGSRAQADLIVRLV
jgi:pantothenate kinase